LMVFQDFHFGRRNHCDRLPKIGQLKRTNYLHCSVPMPLKIKGELTRKHRINFRRRRRFSPSLVLVSWDRRENLLRRTLNRRVVTGEILSLGHWWGCCHLVSLSHSHSSRRGNLRIAASHICVDNPLIGMAFPHVEHFIELMTLSCLLACTAAMMNWYSLCSADKSSSSVR
jgi:hypothetical protein